MFGFEVASLASIWMCHQIISLAWIGFLARFIGRNFVARKIHFRAGLCSKTAYVLSTTTSNKAKRIDPA
jgi:hypothetical protein